MEFRKHRLDNGLEIVAECNDRAYSLAMGFFVNTGSRDETPSLAGVSHFLEHMVFKGTPRRTAAEVNRELDEIGSQSNAFTSEEQTVYYATVLPDYQEEALDLLADIMRPSLRPDDFETEKKVIIEEIHKYDDQPPYGAHERSMANFFRSHPLGNSVLGTVESVGAMSRDAMLDYFEQRYSPGNMTLVATGHVDFEALIAAVDARCGKWKAFDVDRLVPAAPGANGHTEFITRPTATQQYAVQLAAAPDVCDPRRHAHRLLSVVFGDESGSRLYWELVDSGCAEYAVTGTYEFQGAGVTMTYLSCDPEDMHDNLNALKDLQAEVEAEGITEAELELAKSKLCSHVVRRGERPSARLFAVGGSWAQRRNYRTVREVVQSYKDVTTEAIAATLREFPYARHTTVLAGPLSE